MPSHESDSPEVSSCRRLSISSLVDISGDEEALFYVCATATECLEELLIRGLDVAMWKKMVETAFDRNRQAVPLPAPAPRARSGATHSETAVLRKRGRLRLAKADKSAITANFRTFAFAFGRQRLKTSGKVTDVKKTALINAF